MSPPLEISQVRSRDPAPGDRIIYARDGGNGPGTFDDPCGNLDDVLAALELFGSGRRRQIVDCTGFNPTEADHRTIAPAVYGADASLYAPLPPGGPDQRILHAALEWYAALALVQSLTITGETRDPVLDGIQVVDVSETLVPNAHVGQFVCSGFSAGAEYGVITGNTANQITIQSPSGGTIPAGPLAGIYDAGSTWTIGDPGDFFNQPLIYHAGCNTKFTGIRFAKGNSQPCLGVVGPGFRTHFQACRFDQFSASSGAITDMDCCHLWGGMIFDGAGVIRSSFVDGGEFLSHVSDLGFRDCTVRGVQYFGAGDTTSSAKLSLKKMLIEDSPEDGVNFFGPGAQHLQVAVIRNCAGSAIVKNGGGSPLIMQSVSGGGNGHYGLSLRNGAQALVQPGCAVTGSQGDIRVGGAGAKTYAELPAHDGASADPEFCRAYPA